MPCFAADICIAVIANGAAACAIFAIEGSAATIPEPIADAVELTEDRKLPVAGADGATAGSCGMVGITSDVSSCAAFATIDVSSADVSIVPAPAVKFAMSEESGIPLAEINTGSENVGSESTEVSNAEV